MSLSISVECSIPDLIPQAKALAQELGLPFADPDATLWLRLTPERLELVEAGSRGSVYVDFLRGRLGYRRCHTSAATEMLFRAVGGTKKESPPRVIDATAGLGRDAFLLAWLGCHVIAIERSVVMAALLRDGLRRAEVDPAICAVLRERFVLQLGDSRKLLRALPVEAYPDVVFLDPMFPVRKKSAAVQKEMRICRLVAGEEEDAPELLAIAREIARHRVVVKRPRTAPPLLTPTYVLEGRSIRYDIYLR